MGMTRDEALKVWLPVIQMGVETMPECKEALDMAIKALEQEPTAKNDLGVDCIDRAELLKAMNTWDKFGLDSHGYMRRITKDKNTDLVPYVHYEDMVNCVKNMSLVTPQEPKTGHWIEGQTDNPNIHNILCSCCFEGYPSKGHANSQYTREKFKYCPNCGAKMVEPQESEE